MGELCSMATKSGFIFLTSYSLHVPGDFQNETEITLKETLLLGLLSMGGVNGVKR